MFLQDALTAPSRTAALKLQEDGQCLNVIQMSDGDTSCVWLGSPSSYLGSDVAVCIGIPVSCDAGNASDILGSLESSSVVQAEVRATCEHAAFLSRKKWAKEDKANSKRNAQPVQRME